jgi:hypothetical protein
MSQLEVEGLRVLEVLGHWRCRDWVEVEIRRNLSIQSLLVSGCSQWYDDRCSPIEARRGLRAGCIVDKVATELSELVVCCIVMSFRRQGSVV